MHEEEEFDPEIHFKVDRIVRDKDGTFYALSKDGLLDDAFWFERLCGLFDRETVEKEIEENDDGVYYAEHWQVACPDDDDEEANRLRSLPTVWARKRE
jgi:hypothetical protein